ncbi:hypothetical protein ACLMJK_005690 [Lecanora helva]
MSTAISPETVDVPLQARLEVGVEVINGPLDRDASCWREIQSETGCRTYHAYLTKTLSGNDRLHKFPYISKIYNIDPPFRNINQQVRGSCSVFDLPMVGHMTTRFASRGHLLREDATTLLKAFRGPPSGLHLRVLYLRLRPEHMLNVTIVNAFADVLGLGLRVCAEYIDTLYKYLFRSPFSAKNYYDERNHEISSWRRMKLRARTDHMRLNDSLVTMAYDYLADDRPCPPVIIIIGSTAVEDYLRTTETSPMLIGGSPKDQERYGALLNGVSHGNGGDLTSSILAAILPLLQISLDYHNQVYSEARAQYREETEMQVKDKDLEHRVEKARLRLGCQVSDFVFEIGELRKFLQALGLTADELAESPFKELQQESQQYLENAKLLEAELRDWVQLRISNLALEESKRSIELSKCQIEESRRGRNPTPRVT